MPKYLRYPVKLTPNQLRQLAEKQFTLQTELNDSPENTELDPETAVKSLLRSFLYAKLEIFSDNDMKVYLADLETEGSPEKLLKRAIWLTDINPAVFYYPLHQLKQQHSELISKMPTAELLKNISSKTPGVSQRTRLIDAEYFEGQAEITINKVLEIGDAYGVRAPLEERLRAFKQDVYTKSDEDKAILLKLELAKQIYIKEEIEPNRKILVNYRVKEALETDIVKYVDAIYQKLDDGYKNEIVEAYQARVIGKRKREVLQDRLSDIEKHILKQTKEGLSGEVVAMEICIPVDDLYDMLEADFAIRAELNAKLTGSVEIDERTWLGLFPLLNISNAQFQREKQQFAAEIQNQLQNCNPNQTIYISILARAGASGGHYMLFELVSAGFVESKMSVFIKCVNSVVTDKNNDTIKQFCEIVKNAGFHILNENNPRLEYYNMQARDAGCGIAMVENTLQKMRLNQKPFANSDVCMRLTVQEEDAVRLRQIRNILMRQDMYAELIHHKHYPFILVPADTPDPDIAAIRLLPSKELVETICGSKGVVLPSNFKGLFASSVSYTGQTPAAAMPPSKYVEPEKTDFTLNTSKARLDKDNLVASSVTVKLSTEEAPIFLTLEQYQIIEKLCRRYVSNSTKTRLLNYFKSMLTEENRGRYKNIEECIGYAFSSDQDLGLEVQLCLAGQMTFDDAGQKQDVRSTNNKDREGDRFVATSLQERGRQLTPAAGELQFFNPAATRDRKMPPAVAAAEVVTLIDRHDGVVIGTENNSPYGLPPILTNELSVEMNTIIRELEKEIVLIDSKFINKQASWLPDFAADKLNTYYEEEKTLKMAKKCFLDKLNELLSPNSTKTIVECIAEAEIYTHGQPRYALINIYEGNLSRVDKFISHVREYDKKRSEDNNSKRTLS